MDLSTTVRTVNKIFYASNSDLTTCLRILQSIRNYRIKTNGET
jgi:predicted transcriptional regulator